MNKLILLSALLLSSICHANPCADLLAKTKVGGELLKIEDIKSNLIKATYQKMLSTPELAGFPVQCDGSAVNLGVGSVSGGLFLIKGDIYSGQLIREYKLDGDEAFSNSQHWDPSELGALSTLSLDPSQLPGKVPAFLDSKHIFTSELKVVPEKHTRQVTVLTDKDTGESVVLVLQIFE